MYIAGNPPRLSSGRRRLLIRENLWDRMTYAPVSPATLEKAIDRMAAELRISRDALLEALTPVVLEWCITRTAADLGCTSREARTRITRLINRTV